MNLPFRKTLTPGLPDRLFRPPRWLWTRAGEVGWWVRGDWRDALLGPSGLRLEEWRRRGRLTVIKGGPHRIVYRADLDEGTVYVKHFLVPNLRAKVRQWFRRGKGRNEGRRALHLAEIGVSTITPIALGEQRRRVLLLENYLVTHAIPESVPLDEFVERRLAGWPQPGRSRVRRLLATELAELTARMHDAGFAHHDFHPGNILIRMDPGDRPRLAMIDLDAMRVTRPLGTAEALKNLALLNHYFWMRSNRSDRLRFLTAYLRARRSSPPDVRRFALGIEEATRGWAERLWRRWGRRCRGSNKYFETYRGPNCRAVASRDLEPSTVHELLADPDSPFRREGTVLLKDSRTTTVAETTMTVRGRPVRVIFKRFNRKKWLDPILNWFRPSRAWQAWQAGGHLASRGLPTPQNLAVISRCRPFRQAPLTWRLPHETYLVTVKEDSAVSLADYVHQILPALDPEARRAQISRLVVALAKLLRTLHERSLSDRDLKASNILIRIDPSDESVCLSVIDLVGVRLIHPLPRHRRVQNLARLQISLSDVPGRTRTDALRFLRAYLPWGLSTRNDWKGLWREIASSMLSKEARNRRRGRILS